MKNTLKIFAAGITLVSMTAIANTDSGLVDTMFGIQHPIYGSSMGEPTEVRTTSYNPNLVFEGTRNDYVDLVAHPRISLRSGQKIKRIEVRAAGNGIIAISINGRRLQQEISLTPKSQEESYEFQTYSVKVDQVIENQNPAQVKVEVVSGLVRFMDLSVILLKQIATPGTVEGALSAGRANCEVIASELSHGWVLAVGTKHTEFKSPEYLFKAIQNSCKPMRLLCYASEEAQGGKWAISVNLRGEVQNVTGSLGLKDVDATLKRLQEAGHCRF